MNSCATFDIAGLRVGVAHGLGDGVLQALLPSFGPFVAGGERPVDFELSVDEDLPCGLGADLVGTFDTGNGETTVHALEGGGYQYSIKDIHGRECCLLQSGKAFAKSRWDIAKDASLYLYRFDLPLGKQNLLPFRITTVAPLEVLLTRSNDRKTANDIIMTDYNYYTASGNSAWNDLLRVGIK